MTKQHAVDLDILQTCAPQFCFHIIEQISLWKAAKYVPHVSLSILQFLLKKYGQNIFVALNINWTKQTPYLSYFRKYKYLSTFGTLEHIGEVWMKYTEWLEERSNF